MSDIHLRTFRYTCVHGVHLTVRGDTLIRKRILHLGKVTIDFQFVYTYLLWRPIRYGTVLTLLGRKSSKCPFPLCPIISFSEILLKKLVFWDCYLFFTFSWIFEVYVLQLGYSFSFICFCPSYFHHKVFSLGCFLHELMNSTYFIFSISCCFQLNSQSVSFLY